MIPQGKGLSTKEEVDKGIHRKGEFLFDNGVEIATDVTDRLLGH